MLRTSVSKQRNSLVAVALAAVLVLAPTGYLTAKDKKKSAAKASSVTPAVASMVAPMEESKRAVHALNRLTFGPRPGEAERVSAIGVGKWIEQQLNPDKIEDSALEARLAPLRTLQMDSREIVETYPPPQVLKAIAEGRIAMPSDPKKKAMYEAQVAAYKERVANRTQNGVANNGANNGAANGANNGAANNDQDMRPPAMNDEAAQNQRQQIRQEMLLAFRALLAKPAAERAEAVMRMDPAERRKMVQAMNPQDRQRLVADMTLDQREMLLAVANPQGIVQGELTAAKLLRAIYSERQLEEVMTDFWFNHFNVYIAKGADRYLTTSYERETIRKHAMGKFEDLLVATAKDPAMLFYLDNFQSVGPNSMAGQRSGQARGPFAQRFQAQRRAANGQGQEMMKDQDAPPPVKRGLNENYARELMELHTLGVDGGYTQQDIVEVAKVFTGWTVRQPRQGGDFTFNDRIHEPGPKLVLGQKIGESGEGEGRKVLHMLATNPATAKFISKKLAMRFVADDPPPALVDRMAATFLNSDGDIKQVLRTLFQSPEFWAQGSYRAKVKTPLEFVVSAVRVTGAEVRSPQALVQTLNKLGMPLYGAQPPTGYSMKADAWVNSAALLNRMNFALALAGGQLRGVNVSPQRALGEAAPGDGDAALEMMAKAFVAGDISRQTLETIRKQITGPQSEQVQNTQTQVAQMSDNMAPNRPGMRPPGERLGTAAGLILGSPEFQRR